MAGCQQWRRSSGSAKPRQRPEAEANSPPSGFLVVSRRNLRNVACQRKFNETAFQPASYCNGSPEASPEAAKPGWPNFCALYLIKLLKATQPAQSDLPDSMWATPFACGVRIQ